MGKINASDKKSCLKTRKKKRKYGNKIIFKLKDRLDIEYITSFTVTFAYR